MQRAKLLQNNRRTQKQHCPPEEPETKRARRPSKKQQKKSTTPKQQKSKERKYRGPALTGKDAIREWMAVRAKADRYPNPEQKREWIKKYKMTEKQLRIFL
jgi:hypothetical protein